MIGDDENGIVIKKWRIGVDLEEGKIIATNGEAGVQAEMLQPGLHFWKWWWMYSIEKQEIITIEQGQLGIVEALDGKRLPAGHILAANVVDCNAFQDAASFLNGDGQKGWQRKYLANGQYRINPYEFKVTIVPALEIPSNKIGLVTTLDGKPLEKGHIAGPKIGGHSTFQDADAFLKAGGFRGLQEEVLLPGMYYINPKFAQVELTNMTRVEVGYVGVVNSFIGKEGQDTSGVGFQHGNIVKEGEKGIWEKTLDPGLHPIHPGLMEVLMIPTTNIVLNWADNSGDHGLDDELGNIKLRSKDGFDFDMEVSQVINISNTSAAKVIARFGSIENLISQVLEPTIGNYFRNSAQTSDALKFVYERKERQESAREHIDATLKKYDIVCVDTLIGDINPPQKLMDILADRKVAEEQQQMFEMQKKSEEKRQQFVKAETAATKEKELTGAKYDKDIETERAAAKAERAKGDRDAAKIGADGEAYVFTTVGKAKAENIDAVGSAEAAVIKKKTEAMDKEKFAQVEMVRHLAENGTKIVPEILVSGAGGEGNDTLSGVLGALLGKGMLDGLGKADTTAAPTAKEPVASADVSRAETEETFNVEVTEVSKASKEKVVQAVQTVRGGKVKDVRKMFDSLPCTIAEGLSKEDADKAQRLIEEAGGSAKVSKA